MSNEPPWQPQPQRRAARRAGRLYGPAYDGLFRLQQQVGGAEVDRRLRDLDQAVAATAGQLEAPVGQEPVLRRLFEPEAGARATTSLPQPAVVTLNDGGASVTLDAAGNLYGLGSLLSRTRQAVTAALKNPGKVVPGPVIRQFRPQPAMLMSGGSRTAARTAFVLLRPVATAVIDTRPVFAWEPFPGAINYEVTLFAGGKDVLVSGRLPSVPEPLWRPELPLAPGSYSWQVTAFTKEDAVVSPVPPAPEASFRMLAPQEAEALRQAQRSYAGSPLTRGVVLARAGLLDEAEAAFEELLDANPDAPVAQSLLQGVREVRPYRKYTKQENTLLHPAIRQHEKAARSALVELLRTFFGGSVEKAMATLLSLKAADLSPDELDRIADMIEEAKRKGR